MPGNGRGGRGDGKERWVANVFGACCRKGSLGAGRWQASGGNDRMQGDPRQVNVKLDMLRQRLKTHTRRHALLLDWPSSKTAPSPERGEIQKVASQPSA